MIKSPSEMDHYELLDVPREAAADELERAYRMALATWEEGSLATYSLYSEREVELLRERIEHAFRVLSDVDARAAEAPVYVRGFVSAYARCLGLDPGRVVTDYMERFEAARPSATPSLLSAPSSGRLAAGRRGRR